MKIITIKKPDGYFIRDDSSGYRSGIAELRFNGKEPEKTWKSDWYKVESIENIKKYIPERREYLGYKLKKEFSKTKDIPKYVKYEDKCSHFGEYYDENYFNLYELDYKEIPSELEDIEIEIENIGEVKGELVESKIEYEVYSKWGKKRTITNKDLERNLLDEIITPEILEDEVPVKLSSKESYDIIRAYIKDNIDPKHAEITSDYDFCLTVKKRIPLSEEKSVTYDSNLNLFSKRKRKPKFVTKMVKERSFEVYETAPESYRNYSVTKPFVGENVEELKKNIDTFLKELIKNINKPLKDCPNCKGCGVIDN